MAKRDSGEPARKPGRPSKYKEEYAEQARKLCLLGAIDAELARCFDVSEQTINAWKREHPAFLDALKAGKEAADAVIAESLYHRARGYSHPAEKIIVVAGAVERVQYTEHYPPDPTSMIFWLKNRRPDLWRDKPPEGADLTPEDIAKAAQEAIAAATATNGRSE